MSTEKADLSSSPGEKPWLIKTSHAMHFSLPMIRSGMGHSFSQSGIKESLLIAFGTFSSHFHETKTASHLFAWVGLFEEVMFGSVVNILSSFQDGEPSEF